MRERKSSNNVTPFEPETFNVYILTNGFLSDPHAPFHTNCVCVSPYWEQYNSGDPDLPWSKKGTNVTVTVSPLTHPTGRPSGLKRRTEEKTVEHHAITMRLHGASIMPPPFLASLRCIMFSVSIFRGSIHTFRGN